MVAMTHYPDTVIISGLAQEDHKVINYLYEKYLPMVSRFVTRNRGDSTEAEDIFQEALIVLIKSSKQKSFALNCTIKTFLFSIIRNKWFQTLDRNRRMVDVQDLDEFAIQEDITEYEDYVNMQKWIIHRHFLRLSEKCQKILLLYLDQVPMSEIAREMGYKTTKYASKRRHECNHSLIKRILNDPNLKKI